MENLSCSYAGSFGFQNDQEFLKKFGVAHQIIALTLSNIVHATDTKVKECNVSNFGPITEMYNYPFNDILQVDAGYCFINAQKVSCVYCKTYQSHKATYTIKNTQNLMSFSFPDCLVPRLNQGDIGVLDEFHITPTHIQKVLGLGRHSGDA